MEKVSHNESLHRRSERVSEVHATESDTTTSLKYEAPKDYTKPHQTIQSPNRPYEIIQSPRTMSRCKTEPN